MKLLPATLEVPANERSEMIRAGEQLGFDRAAIEATIEECRRSRVYLTDCGTYQVQVRDAGNGFDTDMVSISVKRVDREAFDDWRALQTIKNLVVGEECEAIEIYPAESRLVDSANQRWLWAFTSPSVRVPCGFWERLVTETAIGKSKQRPFERTAHD